MCIFKCGVEETATVGFHRFDLLFLKKGGELNIYIFKINFSLSVTEDNA